MFYLEVKKNNILGWQPLQKIFAEPSYSIASRAS